MFTRKFISFVGMILLVGVFFFMSACAPNVDRLIENGDVEGLIEVAGFETNPELREQAVKALVAFENPEVVYALIDALKDFAPEVRVAAINALGESEDPKTYESIITALNDDQQIVREEAKQTLIALGEPVVEALISNLKSDDNQFRQDLIAILAEIGRPAYSSLIIALANQNENIQSGAYETLIESGEPIVQTLIEALSDEDEFVVDAAQFALTTIGVSVVDPLLLKYKEADETIKLLIETTLKDVFKIQEDEILDSARKVCAGNALPDATEYERYGEGNQPYVILASDGEKFNWTVIGYNLSENWTDSIPVDWLPYVPEQLQVVVCLEEEEKTLVRKCEYVNPKTGANTGSISIFRLDRPLILREAYTGRVIDRTTLRGYNKKCPDYIQTTGHSWYGYVNLSDLSSWLSGFNLPLGE